MQPAVNFTPVTISDSPQSLFYSDDGLPVRVVTVGELPQKWLHRPISILKPGSKSVVTCGRYSEFERGLHRVVTILNPNGLTLLWAFKQDAESDNQGESSYIRRKSKTCKKMTDPSLLREKLMEQKYQEGSVFLPHTSGHVDCNGFRLHKQQWSRHSINVYPELICHLNPRQMHWGYLLDPRREGSFERISEVMANILAMEEANGNSDASQKPVTLCLYDSYRGRLMVTEKLDHATVKKMQGNANALSRYEHSRGMEGKLFSLLAQSGCDRLLALLKKIPDNVQLAKAGIAFPIRELEKAIAQSDAGRFHELLLSVGETRLKQIGLPEHLLNILLWVNVSTSQEQDCAYCAEQFILQVIDNDRLDSLMTDTFAKQAQICRTLLKHGLIFPIISCSHLFSSSNPLVVCLLIAHGSRAQGWKLHCRGDLTLLFSANKFLYAGLLTEEEVCYIRHDILLDSLCYGVKGIPFDSDRIKRRFLTLVNRLHDTLRKKPVTGNLPALDQDQADTVCHQILGDALWDFYCTENFAGSQLKLFLESRLSPHRYSDDKLRQHLQWLKYDGSMTKRGSYKTIADLGGASYYVANRAITRLSDKCKDTDWLSSLLAAPPRFDRCEFARVGRYRAISQTAGQHYYQYHHPNRVSTIATNRVEYVHRRYHGIDHALRTQMATEFLISILPFYHPPFRQLLETYPDLPELLNIAELYHDAVAEDEPKNTEELRAAELFERDMRALREHPDGLVTLVATALKNKNSNEMSRVQTPFTGDDQCSGEELLLRQVLRFGDVVDILRLVPLHKNFLEMTDKFVANSESLLREFGKFDPQAIELLAVVNNPNFSRSIKAALLTFRDLAALTGGWHLKTENPVEVRHQLKVDNLQRRLLVERSPDPYTLMREVLDDLVRLKIAKLAGISPCRSDHQDYVNYGSLPDCWDKTTGVAGTYRKLHGEGELRQVRVPENMTLYEKVCFAAELADEDRLTLSFVTSTGIESEINRLRKEGIQPATGTPSQDELEQIYQKPDSIGASILADRGIVVQQAEHDGRTYFRMMKSKGQGKNGHPFQLRHFH